MREKGKKARASILRWFSLAFLSRRRRGHATAARRRVRRRSGTQPTSAWTYPWLLPLFAIYQATDSGDNTLDGQRRQHARLAVVRRRLRGCSGVSHAAQRQAELAEGLLMVH